MKAIYTLLILLIPFVGFGQGWIQTYNSLNYSKFLYSFEQTSDGGFILIGYTDYDSNVEQNAWLIKIDENGNEEWMKAIGEQGIQEYGRSVQQTSDEGYIITGRNENKAWLVKTDEYGNEQWIKTYSELLAGEGYSVQETNDGGFIISGTTFSFTTNYLDTWISKTDEYGNEQWSKIFQEDNINKFGGYAAYSIDLTSDGGFIFITDVGIPDGFGGGQYTKIRLVKIDENGNEEWKRTFGGNYNDNSTFVQQTQDGGYVITGKTVSFGTEGEADVWLIKVDENGNEEWTKTFSSPCAYGDGRPTSDGGYIIISTYCENIENSYGLLIKTDQNGNQEWNKEITFSDDLYCEGFYSVRQTNDGGYITVAIFSEPIEGGESFLSIIKTDSQGNISSTFEIPLPNPNRKLEKTINLQGQEVKPLINQPIIEMYNDGSVEKKVIIE